MTIVTDHILGAGSVGHLLACRLEIAQKNYQLISRRNRDKQCQITYLQGNSNHSLSIDYYQAADIKAIHRLWVTVKSYQLAEALQSISLRLTEQSQLILLCNGMGNLELARSILPTAQLFVAVNTHGCFYNPENQTLHHSGEGELIIGPDYLMTADTADTLDIASLADSQLQLSWKENIESLVWQKLGINAVINPLTALYQCPNGDLLDNPEIQPLTEQLIDELIRFYKAMHMPALANQFRTACLEVISLTASNFSSMMLDVKNHRKTEIESISGYLLSHANGVRLTLEGHQKLYQKFQKH